ncbi:unnamed protein product [Kluyveromyces dobzhanskii CBS 2104]|uniref:Calcium-transporting ATPase n=1 Tax=Kluyveromyces dobzhanskii CBS 2104 TaxID=1427455 RepID=A0A0A8KZA3_9SACH|nr:unnamed protein product [Kluyveromyces dobzhanskii CBS 2104]
MSSSTHTVGDLHTSSTGTDLSIAVQQEVDEDKNVQTEHDQGTFRKGVTMDSANGAAKGLKHPDTQITMMSVSRMNKSSSFKLTTSQLAELHDPKSLAAFNNVFDNEESNLFTYLQTDQKNGLTIHDEDIDSLERTQVYGLNRIPERKGKTFFRLAWEAFNDKIMILLTIAAVISFSLGLYESLGQPPEYDPEGNEIVKVEWVEGVAIMIAVVVVVLVGAINDYQKELQFAKLNKKKDDREVVVIRNGNEHLISIHDLLVGDVISLQTGDVVPADAILISGSCECDESALTGESDTIKKVALKPALSKYKEIFEKDPSIDIGSHSAAEKVPDPLLISGSKLLSGIGNAVITSVGVNSVNGRTMMALKVETEATPLQERLSNLADNISIYGCMAATILFLILFIKFLTYLPAGKRYHDLPAAQKGSKFMNIFITAITVIVVAVPEGLPLAVTLALAFATTRMTKDGNLVRVLRACETMGSATAICSDKTGTLTENKMSVVKGFAGNTGFDDTTHAENKEIRSDAVLQSECDSVLLNDILTNISLNSTAFENKESSSSDKDVDDNPYHKSRKTLFPWSRNNRTAELVAQAMKEKDEPFLGSKTETALLAFAQKCLGMQDLHKLRNDPASLGVDEIVQTIPFESSRKWGGIAVKLAGNNGYRLHVKGAAEILLRVCSSKRNSDNTIVPLTEELYEQSLKGIQDMASDALRTISLVHRDFSQWPPKGLEDKADPTIASPDLILGEDVNHNALPREGLTLDAMVGLQDPLREGVKESVQQCQRAGVTVRMVTGDNILTARAISRNCNILSEEEYNDPECAMEGPAFRKLSYKKMLQVVPKLRVLARSSPEDKRILVETLKKMREVVAVTGDGTNDAPALKLADVGFSMGISGTEVAREASDIILMTDDFTAIVNAIKWGRCVSVSIKKFIQFQLTVNITAVILTFVSAVASADDASVLTAVQLLWVNLIMDTLAALALATDKPDEFILDRKPKGRDAPLIAVSTWKMILGQAALQLTVTFILHFRGKDLFFPHKEHITTHEEEQLNAMTFNTFVWLQFFKLIVTRKLDEADGISSFKKRLTASNLNFFQHLFRNYYFLAIALLIGGFQILIMYIGGAAFSIARQTPGMWATAIICGLTALPVGMFIRACPDEWALAIFPQRVIRPILYVFGLEFIFKRKKNRKQHEEDEEESLLVEYVNDGSLVESSAFQRAKSDMISHKEHPPTSEHSKYNPITAINRWRSSTGDENESEEEHSFIASVTMVPTLVGGAVGGFSHITEVDVNKKS